MKALCFILSIWIVFCAGKPCADSYVELPGAGTEVSIHMSGEAHAPGADLCSPFCACYCCAVTTALPSTTLFTSQPQPLAMLPDSYICPPMRDFTCIPWQPPRLS